VAKIAKGQKSFSRPAVAAPGRMHEDGTEEIRPAEGEVEGECSTNFIRHTVSRMDNLAGLAIKYNVTVADIKRANGLLSDTAMFAKDTLLIPTRSMSIGVEYSTWAGMIVAQYGRIPGGHHRVGNALSFGGGDSSPKQSAALDQLQRYYGTGDSSSEPGNFRPGDPEGTGEYVGDTEIELSDLDHLRRLAYRRESEGPPSSSGGIEYAGSRSGSLAEDRLRRRKAGEGDCASPSRPSEEGGAAQGASPERWPGGNQAGGLNGSSGHRRAQTQGGGPFGGQSLLRRESLMDRLKRVASQPALAIPQVASLARLGEALVAPPPPTELPPLPPGAKGRQSSAALTPRQPRDRKAD